MIARARERTRGSGLPNVDFVLGDAQIYPFEAGSIDVAISRMGRCSFGDLAMAFPRRTRRALRSGGRLAIMVLQPPTANEWIQEFLRTLLADRPPLNRRPVFRRRSPWPIRNRPAPSWNWPATAASTCSE